MRNVQPLKEGTILKNKYEIRSVLGKGGFAITYLGWDMSLEVSVAIKQFVSESNTDVFAKNRVLEEARHVAKLSDLAEIAQVRDYFEEENDAFIVMEYVDGMTLTAYVKNKTGRMSWDETADIFKKIISALEKVHSTGIIHRDISPENIMLLPDGSVKLLDFDALKDVGNDVAVGQELERTTTAIVKPGYAPIEQYQSRGNLGPWTDVYGVCATIFFCLTAEVPPEAPERALSREALSFADYGIQLPDGVEEALQKGLAIRVQNRIRDMGELYRRLFEPDKNKPEENALPEKDSMKKSGKKHFMYRVAITLASVGVLAAGIAFLDRHLPEVVTEEDTEQNLLDGSYRLSEADQLEEVLLNPDIDCVIIPSGVHAIAGRMELEKKIIVEPDAMLEVGYLCVQNGGHVQVDGTLNACNALLRLSGEEVCVTIAEKGTLLENENTLIWSERSENLEYTKGIQMILNEEEIFSDAVVVNSYEELMEANENGRPIRIDSDLSLPEGGWVTVPMLVSEGVTVISENGNWFDCYGSLLVNRGSFIGGFQLSEKAVAINYGCLTLKNDNSVSLWENSGTKLLNFGKMECDNCSRVWSGALLYNAGAIDAYNFYLMGGMCFNYGEILAKTQKQAFTVTNAGSLYNYGRFMTEEDCHIVNDGWIENVGRFEITDGCRFDNNVFFNRSYFENGFTSTLDEKSGIYFGNGEFRINGITGVAVWKTIDWSFAHQFCEVSSEAELLEALENDDVSEILIQKPVRIEEDIEITKPLFLCADVSASENAVCILKNTYAVLMDGANVNWKTLQLENALWIAQDGVTDLSNASLILKDASAMAVYDGRLEISDCKVSVADKSVLSTPFREELRAVGAEVQLDDASLICNQNTEFCKSRILLQNESSLHMLAEEEIWDACEISVEEESVFTCDFSRIIFLNQNKLVNEGSFFSYGWQDYFLSFGDTDVINRGTMELDINCTIQEDGSIQNEGELFCPSLGYERQEAF